ncbi:ABC transporter ATP-binding protein, partial [Lactobacillus sp. CRM56-2]|nr:ABC transporter ATP-binding protein [Lactobacillus sp. CRM56-2]
LHLLMIKPSFDFLDDIDSGLYIDALLVVSKGVYSMRGDIFGSLIIKHFLRMLIYIVPDVVNVMMGGRIVITGISDLAKSLDKEGYA